ncbi:hypothetical protein [Aerosakkonema funiforme]|uniref:hypothetical protein n=1 Tax=Aerosakkonema funiforme TaxID=1246630 RepID=UPI0035BA8869
MKLGVLWQYLGCSAVYYPKLAKVTGGVTAAILFWHIFERQSQLENPDDWVKINVDEVEEKTGLNSTEQRLARKKLLERSLLKERLVSDANTVEYWADIDALEARWEEFCQPDSRVDSDNQDKVEAISPNNGNSTKTTAVEGSYILGIHIKNDKFFPTQRQPIAVKVTDDYRFNGPWESPEQFEEFQRALLTYFNKHGVTNPSAWVFRIVDGLTKGLISPFWDEFVSGLPLGSTQNPLFVKNEDYNQYRVPWQSAEQFQLFQRALLEYAKTEGFENPSGWVYKIVDNIRKGEVSPFWDEFIRGIPLGESQKIKRDWEIEAGVPYPAFEEERIQYYVQKGEPLEQAVAKARAELRDPVLGKDLWEGFLRKCDRIADEAIKAKNLGVTTPYLPPSFSEKPQITKESVMQKLNAIAPQFSISSSSYNSLTNLSLEQQKVEDEESDTVADIPSLTSLRSAYKTAMGRTLVERQIAEHPEWGYGIIDGEVVDLFPF